MSDSYANPDVLLGLSNVKNYDGSWIEWGNSVGAPIETGAGEVAARPNVKCL
jgi:3-mercaptopyruvate sulfurtransferase SseA